jgi:hypothetical protein
VNGVAAARRRTIHSGLGLYRRNVPDITRFVDRYDCPVPVILFIRWGFCIEWSVTVWIELYTKDYTPIAPNCVQLAD